MIKQTATAPAYQHIASLIFQNRKKAGIYGSVFIIVAFNLCLFLGSNMHAPGRERITTIIQLVCFSIMGVINVWIFYKKNFLAELSLSGAKLAYISLVFLVMLIVLFIYYYASGSNELIMAFASSSAFLLPFLVYQGWTSFIDIPVKNYPYWFLPVTESPVVTSTINSLLLQMEIARRPNDAETHVYPVMASARLKLGKVFEILIAISEKQDNLNSIVTRDNNQQSFAWQFYEEKWAGLYRRRLNPLLTLAANKIKPNTKILILRISAEK